MRQLSLLLRGCSFEASLDALWLLTDHLTETSPIAACFSAVCMKQSQTIALASVKLSLARRFECQQQCMVGPPT
jgi:hypothetical protein